MTQTDKSRKLLDLIRQNTSLNTVKYMLKMQGVSYSAGSWDQLINSRILPAIAENQLNEAFLHDLLRSTEEYGKQNVFLYSCDRDDAISMLSKERGDSIVKKLNLDNLLTSPDIVELPESPTIVDIRRETELRNIESFVIKIVEKRDHRELIREEQSGNLSTLTYRTVPERAVNIFKLYSTGVLEVRIASQKKSEYEATLLRLWNLTSEFFDIQKFRKTSLSKAKKLIWEKRERNADQIKFSDSVLKNDYGSTISASSPNLQTDLFSDSAATSCVDGFLQNDGFHDKLNIWFAEIPGATPSKDIHVILGGDINQFSLPANCSKNDYEHIFNRIRRFNR